MGFFDGFTLRAPELTNVVDAASAPLNNPDIYWNTQLYTVDRNTAMSVPSIARARNIICGIVADRKSTRLNSSHT